MAKNRELVEPKGKDPAVLFYTADFLVGVAFMTMAERGEYITLLCMQHQSGHISPEDFASITQSNKVVAKFEKDDDGYFFHHRMEEEIENRRRFVGSRQKNGALGGRPKKPKENLSVSSRLTYAKPTQNLGENENINENISISNNSDSIFPFSKQQTTTYIFDTYTREEIRELYQSIREHFREEGYISDAQSFIDYNYERGWRGYGGEDALEHWLKYAKAWERKERIRQGVDVNELRGEPLIYG